MTDEERWICDPRPMTFEEFCVQDCTTSTRLTAIREFAGAVVIILYFVFVCWTVVSFIELVAVGQ